MDRNDYYIQILQDRDQALLLLAGLALSGMLWWHLLEVEACQISTDVLL